MNLYNRHILPRYLSWAMKSPKLAQYRRDVVSGLSGIGLEIGFGSGLNLPYYRNVTRLYALEPSERSYTLAKDMIARSSVPIEHIQDSAEHIPLPDNSLDFVVSTWTLCSVPQPEIALKEIFRVLKPGARFSFVEHGKSSNTFVSMIQDLFTPVSRCIAGGCHMNREMGQLITNAGFEMQELDKLSQSSRPLAFMYKGIAIARK